MKKREKVTYVGNPLQGYDYGMVYRDKGKNEDFVAVVYRCGGDWDHFEDYTPVRTDLKDLRRGWIEQPKNNTV